MRGPLLAMLGGVALLGGCATDFDEPFEVLDLRVLAIQAEPPEVLIDDDIPPIALSALVVDPRAPERTVDFRWQACGLTDDLRCDDAAFALALEAGSGPMDAVGATLAITDELREAARQEDTFLGFGGSFFVTQLTLQGDGPERLDAIKQVPGITLLPEGTAENANPSPPALRHDGVDWPDDEVVEVAPGAVVEVEPVSPEEDAEHYAVVRFDLTAQELDEHLGYDFFSTAGSWNRGSSGGAPDLIAVETTLASRWTAPIEPLAGDAIVIWIVVRDGRGGCAWTSRQILLTSG